MHERYWKRFLKIYYGNFIFLGDNLTESQRLKSKLLQLKRFDPPSLNQLNLNEWEAYKGRDLVLFYYF